MALKTTCEVRRALARGPRYGEQWRRSVIASWLSACRMDSRDMCHQMRYSCTFPFTTVQHSTEFTCNGTLSMRTQYLDVQCIGVEGNEVSICDQMQEIGVFQCRPRMSWQSCWPSRRVQARRRESRRGKQLMFPPSQASSEWASLCSAASSTCRMKHQAQVGEGTPQPRGHWCGQVLGNLFLAASGSCIGDAMSCAQHANTYPLE